MTRHALAQHAPGGAIFAVSSYGRRVRRTAAPPPSCTRSACKGRSSGSPSSSRRATATSSTGSGTSPPTTSLACRAASPPSTGAIPRSDRAAEFRARLKALRRRRMRRIGLRLATAAALLVAALAGFDAWEVHAALAFERDNAAPAVARRWASVLAWHPSLPFFWPDRAKPARGEARRMDGQGGRGPGRQRHGRPRPARRAGRPQGRGPAPRPGDPQGRGRAGPGAGTTSAGTG